MMYSQRLFRRAVGIFVLVLSPVAPMSYAAPTRYYYDDLNRLVRVERPDCAVVTYTYDPLGNRLTKTVVNDRDCDGTRDTFDCAPLDATAWGLPGEAAGLTFSDKTAMTWSSPATVGGTSVRYDLVRSSLAADFGSPACPARDLTETTASDPTSPDPGAWLFYLVRAKNACGGNLGAGSGGAPRVGGGCP